MIERHQDYILQIPSIAPGQTINPATLILDTDAPFLCRAVGLHFSPPPATRTQTDIQSCLFSFRNQAGADLTQFPIQTPQYFGLAFGQNGQYKPVWPQQPYPPGGLIQAVFTNNSADTLTNLQLIFRGVKLFADGTIPNPTYPARFRPIDFTYQTGKGTQTDLALILATTDTRYQLPLQINGDADFVLRAGQAGLWDSTGSGGAYSTFGYTELYIQLMDSTLKPYSNLPIHIDWLFGNGGGSDLPSFTKLGNSAPGLIVPEIYLPKNSMMYYNLYRQDAAYVGVTDALPVRVSLAWIGSKVYA